MSLPYRLFAVLALTVAFVVAPGCDEPPAAKADTPPKPKGEAPIVAVHVFNKDGKLVGPVKMPAVRLSVEAWKKRLDDESFRILRRAGTEPAHCGDLLDNKREGVYACKGCSLPLFSSDAKFKSGTGWPSFYQPVADVNIEERADNSYGMVRTEILCARCEGHLGHVFTDGPRPTGLRYCLNSASMVFTDADKVKTLADPFLEKKAKAPKRAEVVFAGGCFWCVEAVFEELEGVYEAISGYAGGAEETATYGMVAAGVTKHAEAVKIVYDPSKITYTELLEVHFATHDPTTLNRQGADRGPHYRSAIFYANEEERKAAAAFIAKHQKKLGPDRKIVTTLEPLDPLVGFYTAEKKHQDFVAENPNQPYVRAVAKPKVEKVRKVFKDKLKKPAKDGDK